MAPVSVTLYDAIDCPIERWFHRDRLGQIIRRTPTVSLKQHRAELCEERRRRFERRDQFETRVSLTPPTDLLWPVICYSDQPSLRIERSPRQ